MIKSILGGKSKNLFQLSDEVGVLDGGLGPNVARNFEENKWYIGLTSNNYYIPSNITEYSIKDDLIYFKRDSINSNGYGLARAIKCEPNITYTLSFEPIYSAEYYAINIGYFDKDGNLISTNNIAGTSKTITTPNNCNWLVLVFNFYDIYDSGKGEIYFGYIQLELGSTATEYVPHELTSYKSIMKVSDVCQLVDKNKIPTTRTISGVTFTNNGDGSVTVNGTSTHQYYSEVVIPVDDSLFIPGHVYLNGTVAGDFAGFVALYGPVARDYVMYPQQIYTLPSGKDFNKFRYIIRVRTGMTANDYKCTPQPFDLTKMFGAGNEPKTVAEFKAKFPNDYYPYSPSCFVTSFDERMSCKTKNLINSQQIYQISQHMNVTIWQGEVNYVCTFSYELSMLEPNTGMAALFEFAYSDGTYSYIVSRDKYRVLSQITDSKKLTKIRLINWSDIKGIISNIQLEKGTKATDYVPYGYV